MILVREASECVRDPEVCDARLAVSSNQDIVLNISNISMGFIYFLASPTGVRAPCKISNP